LSTNGSSTAQSDEGYWVAEPQEIDRQVGQLSVASQPAKVSNEGDVFSIHPIPSAWMKWRRSRLSEFIPNSDSRILIGMQLSRPGSHAHCIKALACGYGSIRSDIIPELGSVIAVLANRCEPSQRRTGWKVSDWLYQEKKRLNGSEQQITAIEIDMSGRDLGA